MVLLQAQSLQPLASLYCFTAELADLGCKSNIFCNRILHCAGRRTHNLGRMADMNVLLLEHFSKPFHCLRKVDAVNGKVTVWQLENRQAADRSLAVKKKRELVRGHFGKVKIRALYVLTSVGRNHGHVRYQSPNRVQSPYVITIASSLLYSQVVDMLLVSNQKRRNYRGGRSDSLHPCWPVKFSRRDVKPCNSKNCNRRGDEKNERQRAPNDRKTSGHGEILA